MRKQKLADLLAIESALKKLISACHKRKNGCGCPIIDSLISGKTTLWCDIWSTHTTKINFYPIQRFLTGFQRV